MVLEMPVHVPVEEFGQRVEGDGADGFTEIRIAAFQPAMHRHPNQIAPQVGDERGTRNQQRQNGLADGEGAGDDDAMKQQRNSRPDAGATTMLIIPVIQFLAPGIERVVEPVRRDRDKIMQRRHDALRLVSPKNVHGQELQKIQRAQGRGRRHDLFPVAFGVQGEPVVIVVAELIDLEIVPAKKREDPQKRFIHPFGLEHGAMAQLMMWCGEEGPDRPMDEQGCSKPDPHLLHEQIESDTASCRPEAKMAKRHQQPECIVGCHQATKNFLIDGTTIPADLQRFADFAHWCQFHIPYRV